MTGELWMKRPCEHGEIERHSLGYRCDHPDDGKPHDLGSGVCHVRWCDAGSEERLKPMPAEEGQ